METIKKSVRISERFKDERDSEDGDLNHSSLEADHIERRSIK